MFYQRSGPKIRARVKCAHRHNSTMLIARAQGKKSEGPDSLLLQSFVY